MKTTLFASLAFASLMVSSVASAQGMDISPADARLDDERPAPPPPVPMRNLPRRWYGWQTIIGEAAADAVIYASFEAGDAHYPMLIAGVVGKGLAGPIVHAAHGHPGKAAASLGINAGAVLLFGVPAVAAAGGYGVIFGLAAGLTVGPIIDISALSTEEIEPKHARSKHPLAPHSWGLAPIMAKGQQGLAFTGTF